MSTPGSTPTSRRAQLVQSYQFTKRTDPRIGLYMLGAFVLGAGVGFLLVWLIGGRGWLSILLGTVSALLMGLLLALVVFGRRAMRARYADLEGQPAAAGGVLQMLRRGWTVSPVVAFDKQQDVVHRVIGPPGIVLVGEGPNPQRVRQLLASERRKHERVLAETPVHEVVAGNGEGEVPLPKLIKHVTKMRRNVRPAEITDILNRMKALDAHRGTLPIPKGPMPTSMKGMRGQQRGR
jgi:hypothetical protein